LFIGGFFRGKTFLVFIRKINGANLGAFTTAGAFVKVNKTGLFANPGLEFSRFAFEFYQFAFS
jgi:hypothetical protein